MGALMKTSFSTRVHIAMCCIEGYTLLPEPRCCIDTSYKGGRMEVRGASGNMPSPSRVSTLER